jgi:ABC-2 type transport system ATP-binding protein
MAATVLSFAERWRPNWDAAYADALIERFQVPTDRNVNKLSRGMKSALGVTIGLASRAPLTIFDEAYLGMDAPSRYAFYEEADRVWHRYRVVLRGNALRRRVDPGGPRCPTACVLSRTSHRWAPPPRR